jgi:NADPH:quinone reductase-like Zn-dependent oxidoreductase
VIVGSGRAGRFNVVAESTPDKLQRLAELFDDGVLRVPIQKRYELEQAGEALQAFISEHTQGKLGIIIGSTIVVDACRF